MQTSRMDMEFNLDFLETTPPRPTRPLHNDDVKVKVCMFSSQLMDMQPACMKTPTTSLMRLNKAGRSKKLAERIADTDDLVRHSQQLEQQLLELKENAQEISKLYESERLQRVEHETKAIELKERCALLDGELVIIRLQYDEVQAKLQEFKQPIEYNKLTVILVRLLEKLNNERKLHNQDQFTLKKMTQYCMEHNLYVPQPRSPKKRTTKKHKASQCMLLQDQPPASPTIIISAPKEMRQQGTQCEPVAVSSCSQGTQYISTTTTRSTSTACFIKQRHCGTMFPEQSAAAAFDDILQELRLWSSIEPVSPIVDAQAQRRSAPQPPSPSLQEVLHRNIGTCTYLCNIRRQIDFLPTTAPSIKREVHSRTCSPTRTASPANAATTIGHSAASHLGLSTALAFSTFEELWGVFGQMLYGLLQHRTSSVMHSPQDAMNQHTMGTLRSLYDNIINLPAQEQQEQQQTKQPARSTSRSSSRGDSTLRCKSEEKLLQHSARASRRPDEYSQPAAGPPLRVDTDAFNASLQSANCSTFLSHLFDLGTTADSPVHLSSRRPSNERSTADASCTSETSTETLSLSSDNGSAATTRRAKRQRKRKRKRTTTGNQESMSVSLNVGEETQSHSEAMPDLLTALSEGVASELRKEICQPVASKVQPKIADGETSVTPPLMTSELSSKAVTTRNFALLTATRSSLEKDLRCRSGEHADANTPIATARIVEVQKEPSESLASNAEAPENAQHAIAELSNQPIVALDEGSDDDEVNCDLLLIDDEDIGDSSPEVATGAAIASPTSPEIQVKRPTVVPSGFVDDMAGLAVVPTQADLKRNPRKRKNEIAKSEQPCKRSARLFAKQQGQLAIPVEMGKYTRVNSQLRRSMEKIDEDILPTNREGQTTLAGGTNKYDNLSLEVSLGFFREHNLDEPTTAPAAITRQKEAPQKNTPKAAAPPPAPPKISPAPKAAKHNCDKREKSPPAPPESCMSFVREERKALSPGPPAELSIDAIYDSPASPPPSSPLESPNVADIPLEVAPCFSEGGLIDCLIAHYRDERSEAEPKRVPHAIEQKLSAAIRDYLEQSHDTDVALAVLALIENLQSISKQHDSIVMAIVGAVRPLQRPEFELGCKVEDVPGEYMSVHMRRLGALLHQLYMQPQDGRQWHELFVAKVEALLFQCWSTDNCTLNEALNLTQFYLLVISEADTYNAYTAYNPARLFVAKCLYYHYKKATPMVYHALCKFPSMLPHRDERTYDRSDALITVLQHALMCTTYDMDKRDMRTRELLSKLRFEYHFEPFKPDRQEVLANLLAKLRAGKLANIAYALAIYCKRQPPKFVSEHVLTGCLLPLANEYYSLLQQSNEYDERVAAVLHCISVVIKPFPLETDVSGYLALFARFLNAVPRLTVQEAAVQAVLRLQRFGFMACYQALHDFKPKAGEQLQLCTQAMLQTFVRRKPLKFWLPIMLQQDHNKGNL